MTENAKGNGPLGTLAFALLFALYVIGVGGLWPKLGVRSFLWPIVPYVHALDLAEHDLAPKLSGDKTPQSP